MFTAEQVYKHNGDTLPKNQRTAKVCLLCPDSCIVRHKHDTHNTLGFESVEEVPSASRLHHVPGVGPNCNQQARRRQGKEEKIVVFFSLSLTSGRPQVDLRSTCGRPKVNIRLFQG